MANRFRSALLVASLLLSIHLPIRAQSASTLNFQVVDDKGQPLAGAQLSVIRDGDETKATAAQDGSALLTVSAPPKNYFLIHVEAPGFVDKEVIWNQRSTADSVPATYTLRMERGVRAWGHVIDDAGQPIAGANVVFWVRKKLTDPHERIAGEESVKTDDKGVWSFDGVPDGIDSLMVGAWDYHHVNSDIDTGMYAIDDKPLEQLKNGSITFTLARGAEVRGVVRGPDGKPVAGAKVSSAGDLASNRVPEQVTGEDGVFYFTGKPESPVVLTVRAKGFATEMTRATAGNAPRDLSIQLATARPLKGQVVDAEGKPVPFAWIYPDTWRGARSLSDRLHADDQGRFVWNEAPTDTVYCDIDATASGFLREQRVAMTASDTEIIVKVRRALHVTGTVVDAETLQPIPDFLVIRGISFDSKRPISWQRPRARGGTTTEGEYHNGKFDYVEDFARPGYATRIEASGYLPFESQVFSSDESSVNLEIKLQRGKNIVATVIKADHEPAAGVTGLLVLPGQNGYIQNGTRVVEQGCIKVVAGADGVLTFPPQASAFKLIVFGDAGYVEVDSPQLASSDRIVIAPWARIEGHLVVGNHVGAGEQVSVSLTNERFDEKAPRVMHQIETKADQDGHFVFDRVPAGEVTVARDVIQPSGGGFMVSHANSRAVVAMAGQTLQTNLGGTGRSVVGKVNIPPELANRTDWNFDLGHLRTHADMPELPVPDDLKNAPIEKRQAWYKEFQASDAGKAYAAALASSQRGMIYVPLQLKSDGTFRADDVEPGTFDLSIAIVQHADDNTCPGGDPIATGLATVIVPASNTPLTEPAVEVPAISLTMLNYISIGQLAPNFDLKTLDDKPLKLSDLRGKFVLLDFWATWCGPCVEEIPSIKAAYSAFKDDPRFVMISVSLDNKADDAKTYAQKNGMEWNQVFVEGGWESSMVKTYGVRSIPSIWLIGPDGKVINRDMRGDQIRSAVDTALRR